MRSILVPLADGSASPEEIDEVMEKLGVNESMMTDPELIRDILEHDMFLGDFDLFKNILGDALGSPQALAPLLRQMRDGIVENHPAICEFLRVMLAENLLAELDSAAYACIKRTVHNIYLVDILVRELAANLSFMVAFRNQMQQKRASYGIRSQGLLNFWDIFRAMQNLFTAVKLVTMDKAFDSLLRAREAGQIEESSIRRRRNLLIINILEAVFEDKRQGYSQNSMVGIALAITPMEQVLMKGSNRTIEYVLPQEWTSLYQTWNLAFMMGNIDNLHIAYPKLLIPQVLCAKSNDYIYNRAIALWSVLNFLLFAKVSKQDDLVIPKHRDLAKIWGAVNLKYAQAFFAKSLGTELRGFTKLFRLLVAALFYRKKNKLSRKDSE